MMQGSTINFLDSFGAHAGEIEAQAAGVFKRAAEPAAAFVFFGGGEDGGGERAQAVSQTAGQGDVFHERNIGVAAGFGEQAFRDEEGLIAVRQFGGGAAQGGDGFQDAGGSFVRGEAEAKIMGVLRGF
jgi:hypothetical protein